MALGFGKPSTPMVYPSTYTLAPAGDSADILNIMGNNIGFRSYIVFPDWSIKEVYVNRQGRLTEGNIPVSIGY
ncbi:hypothetical protein SAMN02745866_00833 [Alteromonadaceae bacterium Bs31]|nr:hypothetical protein SAMN02745866_00833 [Alteromonadaceae bacterium Bs31]